MFPVSSGARTRRNTKRKLTTTRQHRLHNCGQEIPRQILRGGKNWAWAGKSWAFWGGERLGILEFEGFLGNKRGRASWASCLDRDRSRDSDREAKRPTLQAGKPRHQPNLLASLNRADAQPTQRSWQEKEDEGCMGLDVQYGASLCSWLLSCRAWDVGTGQDTERPAHVC
ncbi:hypothetical protein EJ05DRAFT_372427 [Pseudovirgaria hyperparasitica]|uniref:Uncharacterized protein n=1 Tax=Pseudovirgaria hyperparasitica TaxID=470096 RepID=A0A6A6W6W1_9PEZI|nr:uncharacterized protein EJ05DRAFT_372427 [Pseudovirgaria hyperparasitica]KAF2757939.1 hypothetical protein EJ05DRAFT_372427 [Pseudovirgaria hyperparasitica]